MSSGLNQNAAPESPAIEGGAFGSGPDLTLLSAASARPAPATIRPRLGGFAMAFAGWVLRIAVAVAIALAVSAFIGATAWSAPSSRGYSSEEIRAVETDREAEVRKIRDAEIKQIRIALGRRAPENRMAELYFRLAEAYLEAYRTTFLLEGRVHEKRIAEGRGTRKIDRSYSRPYLQKGIDAAKEILKYRIPFDKTDRVYYFLAFNYGELGNSRLSQRYYQKLADDFPKSEFAVEAYRALGDSEFESNSFPQAQAYYLRALANPKSKDLDTLPRIYHRLAWSYYRTRKYERAIESMKRAIEESARSGEKMLSLREEALKDMAVFMTERGKVDEALGYFSKVAGQKDYYANTLEALGREYERTVQPEKAAEVYEALLKARPEDEAAFRVTVKLVDLDLRRSRFKSALARIRAAKFPSSDDFETKMAAQNLRAMVRRTATEHHEKYRKKKAKETLQVAEEYYSVYLERFLSSTDKRNEIPEVQMYLAEVKRDLGKSAEASDLYRKVIESRDERYAKEAGALWTASLSEAIRKSAAAGKLSSSADEPSQLEKEFIVAADQLQASLPESREARESALRAAQILAGYSKTRSDGIERAKGVISKWPDSEQGLTAARLWVQVLADRVPDVSKGFTGIDVDHYVAAAEALREGVTQVKANAKLMAADESREKGSFARELAAREHQLRVGAIALFEHDKNFGKAGAEYESFARSAGSREGAEKAYASAIEAYLRSGDFDSVDRVAEDWLKRYRRSRDAVRAVRAAATRQLIQGEYARSAGLFRKLGAQGDDAASLETAARIYEGAGLVEESAQTRSAYLKDYGKSASRWDVSLALARLQQSAGKFSESVEAYGYCMRGPADYLAECAARLGDLYLQRGDLTNAGRAYTKAASSTGHRGRSRSKRRGVSPYVGYARYRLAEMREKKATFQPLAFPEERLQGALTARLGFFETLSRAYLRAVDAGGPWAIAALDGMARWAIGFADEVDAIQPPKSLEGEQLASFRRTLAAVSGPLRAKALETWMKAYRTAQSASVLSPVLPEILDRLADQKVRGVERAQGYRGRFRLAGISPTGGESGLKDAITAVRAKLLANGNDSAAWVDYGNLLWGEKKPQLAGVAYERALALDSKNAAALNNQAVVLLSADGEEDWFAAAQADALLDRALDVDRGFAPAQMNRASLYTYYRLFALARPLWDGVVGRLDLSDAHEGRAAALFGLGHPQDAAQALAAARKAGGDKSGFIALYHRAAGAKTASECLDHLDDIDSDGVGGFELRSVQHLKEVCRKWKEAS